MRKIITLSIITLLSISSTAQDTDPFYETSVGLRLGFNSGVSVKHFFKNDLALEGIGAFRVFSDETVLTLLIEKHIVPKAASENLLIYIGAGGHVGYNLIGLNPVYGINVIVGGEYDLEPALELPLTISGDVTPAIGFPFFVGSFFQTGVTVRYKL